MIILFISFYLSLSSFNHANYREFQRDKIIKHHDLNNDEESNIHIKKIESMNITISKKRLEGIIYLVISLSVIISSIYQIKKRKSLTNGSN